MNRVIEFLAAWMLLKAIGLLPRRGALAVGKAIGRVAYWVGGGLRRTGRRNLEIAFPEKPEAERERILKRAFENLGRHLGEFSQFPKYKTAEDAFRVIGFRGRERVMDAIESGRGVLFFTGHMGAWEMKPFMLQLSGTPPVSFLVRRIDNPLVERLADRYRTLHGNVTIDKKNAARPTIAALRRGEVVGILIDLNTLDNESVFVDFFGKKASTTPGVAVFALRTNALVLPVFTYWSDEEQRYILHFYEPVEVTRSGSKEEDVLVNTQRFTAVVEQFIREHPDEWLWIHKRWKTRPPGEPAVY